MPSQSSLPVFIVSGGARGITAQCVIELASALPSQWILLGRSALMATEPSWANDCDAEADLKQRLLQHLLAQGEKPTPITLQKSYGMLAASREISKTLQTLEKLGSSATYVSADITDSAELKAQLMPLLERLDQPVTGLIHGAGNLADKRIEKKTEQDFDRVYGAKVQGLENLLLCVPINQLKYLVLFSSVVGFYGNAGQSDYALANEILNKTAHWVKQQQPECHAVAINWGPWESGMVTPALKAAFEQRGIDILPIAAATQMLVNELSDRYHSTAQVVVGGPIPVSLTVLSGGLKTYRLRRQLSLAANPFLSDHVIAGSPVLPFTCALAWMAHGTEQIYPDYRASLCEQIRLLKGIVFDHSLADEYTLELTELSKNDAEIVITARISSQTSKGATRYHFSSRITLRRQELPIPTTVFSPHLLESAPPIFDDFYDPLRYGLFHGASFRGIKRILEITPEHITAECLTRPNTARQQGQFPAKTLDPFSADVLLHPILVWLKHYHQLVCLPTTLERYEVFESPPYDQLYYATINITARTPTSLTVNVVSHDEKGNVYTLTQGGKSTIFPASRQIA